MARKAHVEGKFFTVRLNGSCGRRGTFLRRPIMFIITPFIMAMFVFGQNGRGAVQRNIWSKPEGRSLSGSGKSIRFGTMEKMGFSENLEPHGGMESRLQPVTSPLLL